MKIRNCCEKDLLGLIHLLKITESYDKNYDTIDKFGRKIEYDPKSIIVTEYKGMIIGSVFLIFDPWASFIYHVVVHPEYQNQGLGSKLMKEAEKRLKIRGIDRPTLFVREHNKKALIFYKKWGGKQWKRFGIWKNKFNVFIIYTFSKKSGHCSENSSKSF